jgi:uncharacterized protein YbjT (DUF2867 family)
MAILVMGATGTIGSQVLASLDPKKVEVRALTRAPEKAKLPAGVTAVKGDPADVDSIRAALDGVSTLFLLGANVADELTQVMLTLNAARDAGVKGVVYLSVFKGAEYSDVPHFVSKATVERMIEAHDIPATILRPSYFMQNDLRQKDVLLDHGAFGLPIGGKGISMVDIRDIGEAAARELMRRETAPGPLPRETYNLVGPDAMTGASVAAVWSEVLGRTIAYGGDDVDLMEQRLKAFAPAWYAYDLKLMMRTYQAQGAVGTATDIARLEALLGHKLRTYRDFAKAAATAWQAD